MKLPSSFRRFLRKVAQYAGPVGTATVLRGCPCPAPVTRPPQPFTSSIAVDADTTLDATGATWNTWCAKTCGNGFVTCYIQVNTSDNNSMPISAACNTEVGTIDLGGDSAPWIAACKQACSDEQDCLIGPDATIDNTPPIVHCKSWWIDCAGGRRTQGIDTLPPLGNDRMGLTLARMAALEAESVPAFRRLKRELEGLGAPRKLRKRAARSRRDEQRHTRIMTSLARRHGSTAPLLIAPEKQLPNRPLEEVALENAIEGCVRETYGAWMAWKQANNAQSAELRATMRRIALDEARHATLAWDIHRWALARLDKKTTAHITQAMTKTWLEIAANAPDANDVAAQKLGLVAR